MDVKIAVAVFAVFFQHEYASSQVPIGYVPNPMSAAELWNPYAWYLPFAIASAESYRDYFLRAQDATNKLYYQAYQSNAYPWITGYGTRLPYPNIYKTTTAETTTTQTSQTTAATTTTQGAQTASTTTTQAPQTTTTTTTNQGSQTTAATTSL